MINSFLGKKEIVDILVSNEKAKAIYSPSTLKLLKIFGPFLISIFGYPQTISSRTRARDIFSLLSKVKGSVIDIGCAFGGAHTFELARRMSPHSVVGLDIDPISIDVANRINSILNFSNLHFILGDIVSGIDITDKFDIAFAIETLEHIQDDRAALDNIAKILKPLGYLVVSVPYCENPIEHNSPEMAFSSINEANDSELFIGGYHWRSGYNEEQLHLLADSSGFEILSIIYTKTVSSLPNQSYLFPLMYPLSRISSRFFGSVSKINILVQKKE